MKNIHLVGFEIQKLIVIPQRYLVISAHVSSHWATCKSIQSGLALKSRCDHNCLNEIMLISASLYSAIVYAHRLSIVILSFVFDESK